MAGRGNSLGHAVAREYEFLVGTPVLVGGKSVYWGGWCPRLTDGDLASWPPTVARYLKDNYPLLERQLGVSEVADFIHGPLYQLHYG